MPGSFSCFGGSFIASSAYLTLDWEGTRDSDYHPMVIELEGDLEKLSCHFKHNPSCLEDGDFV